MKRVGSGKRRAIVTVDTDRPYASHAMSYTAYARCLRHTGDTIAAKRILDGLVSSRLANEAVLLEKSALDESMMDWAAAEEAIQELIRLRPDKAAYYFRLGRAQVGANELDAAEKSYRLGLTQTHPRGWDAVVRCIQDSLPGNRSPTSSKYTLTGGFDNFGGLVNRSEAGEYFTKIVQARRDRETLFYHGLLTQHPQLASISPRYYGSHDIDGLRYLTVQMLTPPDPAPELSQIIDISRTIQSVGYCDVGGEYANPAYKFELKFNTPSVVKGFTHIHRERYNRQLFDTLHRLAPSAHDAETAESVVAELESIIMKDHLYALMSPAEHYTLLHGDFKPSNIMSDAVAPRFLRHRLAGVQDRPAFPGYRQIRRACQNVLYSVERSVSIQ